MVIRVNQLGLQDYHEVWDKMKYFTQTRDDVTQDELWLVEHPPVYTQGQAGKSEHIFHSGNIPVIQSDRGGQVTYHGPGQLIAYVLFDLKRRQMGVRTLICDLEQIIIDLLATHEIEAHRQIKAPGVYVSQAKIASVGLRVKNNCSYHGIALNVDMDLRPFEGIHPCGYQNLTMTQIKDCDANTDFTQVKENFIRLFLDKFTTYSAREPDANIC